MRPFAALAAALLLLSLPIGCSRSVHHPASAIEAAAAARERALQQARAAAAARDQDREGIAGIPLPTKSVYLAIHTRQSWANPFLIVGKSTVNLSILMPDNGPAGSPGSEVLRPVAARRRVLDLRLSDLPEALAALPESVWPYGRVIAVQEDPLTQKQDRAAMRGNVEATMQVLNDLGIVIDDWSSTGPR
ncbi:MAG TPA: hypothetical protein VHZ25_03810 [Acidobacteriaceae bacterium]|jgi:hypothetical protein|nr:hypothetical protein [Acidobacteriaceae bacterium]